MILKISKEKFIVIFVASILYSFICCALDYNLIFSTVMISCSLFIGLTCIFDWTSSVLSIRNIFFILFFGCGVYLRYFVILCWPDEFCNFIYTKVEMKAGNYTNASSIILLVTMIFAAVYLFNSKKRYYAAFNKKDDTRYAQSTSYVVNYTVLNVIWVVAATFVYAYNIINVQTAVNLTSFHQLDFLTTIIRNIVRAISYTNLLAYFHDKTKKGNLAIYVIFFVLDCYVSFIQAWKGKIIYEILAFLVLYCYSGKRLKIKQIGIFALLVLIIYPSITIYRDILFERSSYSLGISGILSYLKEENLFIIISERYAYYDEIFHCVNLAAKVISNYLAECGTIVQMFFSSIIPRFLWPNKPSVAQGLYITWNIFGKPYNTSSTITYVGDAFLSYGYVGVAIVTFFYSLLLKNRDWIVYLKDDFETSCKTVMSFIFLTFMEGALAGKFVTVIATYILLSVCRKISKRNEVITNVEELE